MLWAHRRNKPTKFGYSLLRLAEFRHYVSSVYGRECFGPAGPSASETVPISLLSCSPFRVLLPPSLFLPLTLSLRLRKKVWAVVSNLSDCPDLQTSKSRQVYLYILSRGNEQWRSYVVKVMVRGRGQKRSAALPSRWHIVTALIFNQVQPRCWLGSAVDQAAVLAKTTICCKSNCFRAMHGISSVSRLSCVRLCVCSTNQLIIVLKDPELFKDNSFLEASIALHLHSINHFYNEVLKIDSFQKEIYVHSLEYTILLQEVKRVLL